MARSAACLQLAFARQLPQCQAKHALDPLENTITPFDTLPCILPSTGLLPPFRPLQDLHARLQPLLIFFIDAANYIDDGAGGVDPRWELYLATELTAAGQIIVSFVLRSQRNLRAPQTVLTRLPINRVVQHGLLCCARGQCCSLCYMTVERQDSVRCSPLVPGAVLLGLKHPGTPPRRWGLQPPASSTRGPTAAGCGWRSCWCCRRISGGG